MLQNLIQVPMVFGEQAEATDSNKGIIRIATDEEVDTGLATDICITPAQLKDYVDTAINNAIAAIDHDEIKTFVGVTLQLVYTVSHSQGTDNLQIQVKDTVSNTYVLLTSYSSTSEEISVTLPLAAVVNGRTYKVFITKLD